MMKILFVAPYRRQEGHLTAHSFIDEEIRDLSARGVRAFVLAPSGDGEELVDGIHVLPIGRAVSALETARTALLIARSRAELGPVGSLDAARQSFYAMRRELIAAAIVRRQGIDLIHSHFGFPGGLGGSITARETGVPLVATFRGMDLACDPDLEYGMRCEPRFDRQVRYLLSAADRTTYFSDYMRARGIDLGARPETATTIRKGVDLEQFRPDAEADAARRRLELSGQVVLYVGNLLKQKGVDLILEAFARLPAEQGQATLVVCGEGPERANLEQLARRLDIHDRVRFEGRISRGNIPEYFEAADVFVLGSRREAAGNVILEAMASARPVVSTASGGPQEYVVDGESGFVVPVDDSEAFALRLAALLDSPELRMRMGRAGRLRVEREFAYGRMTDEMLSIYRDVLESREHH